MTNLAEDFRDRMANNAILRSCLPMLDKLQNKYGDEYGDLVWDTLALGAKLGWNCEEILLGYLVDYLKEQIHLLKTGEYGHGTFEEIRKAIYDNPKVMLNSYMPGLFLAYSFTPILFEKYHFFAANHIPEIGEMDTVVEIGFGDGFYLWNLRRHGKQGRITGFDISTSAVEFATDLLAAADMMNDSMELRLGNIMEGVPAGDGIYDHAILAEIIEHIPNPSVALGEAQRLLKDKGCLYVSTVMDSNHMDHMTNFACEAAVEQLLMDNGFHVADRHIYRLMDENPNSRDKSVGLAYLCRK